MSQDSQPMRFYVLRVLSGQEKKVCEYIEAAKSNGALGSYVRRVLVPTEQVVYQHITWHIGAFIDHLLAIALRDHLLGGNQYASYVRA